jgi:murein DD-endopeptidase MepM/ murein hydrolase activator NlpD
MKVVVYSILALCLFSCAGIQPRYYEVAPGDNLAKIAARYQVPADQIEKHNHDQLEDGLKPGLKLYIPFETDPHWNAPEQAMADEGASARGVASDAPAYDVAPADFGWPVSGSITSGFGRRALRGHAARAHEGIDIAARRGTPVKASRSGHVIYASNKISGYGNMIIVKHADNYSTVYAHLSKFNVKKGQFVARGQKLGAVGKTGRAYGYHLHFEIRRDRDPVNPLLYLQGQYATNILNR